MNCTETLKQVRCQQQLLSVALLTSSLGAMKAAVIVINDKTMPWKRKLNFSSFKASVDRDTLQRDFPGIRFWVIAGRHSTTAAKKYSAERNVLVNRSCELFLESALTEEEIRTLGRSNNLGDKTISAYDGQAPDKLVMLFRAKYVHSGRPPVASGRSYQGSRYQQYQDSCVQALESEDPRDWDEVKRAGYMVTAFKLARGPDDFYAILLKLFDHISTNTLPGVVLTAHAAPGLVLSPPKKKKAKGEVKEIEAGQEWVQALPDLAPDPDASLPIVCSMKKEWMKILGHMPYDIQQEYYRKLLTGEAVVEYKRRLAVANRDPTALQVW